MRACDYCGRQNDDTLPHCLGCGTELPQPPVAELPPTLPTPKLINVATIESTFSLNQGFHLPDWGSVQAWIDSHISLEQQEEAWNEASLLWLSRLRDDLGGAYYVHPASQILLLSDRPLEEARWLSDFAGRAAITIKKHLGDTAWNGALGKDIVLAFSNDDDYYSYVSCYTPDGEQTASGGVCIHSG